MQKKSLVSFLSLVLLMAGALSAQPFDAKYLAGMRWRSIGPYRGGRTRAVAGVPSQPNVFYIGVCNGGVWKSTDYGRRWDPIFDDQPTGSIGAVAVAPSDPNTVYVTSGEGLQRPDLSVGDGVYRSTDAGRTWTRLGLRDGQQIPQIIVDPRNRDRIFVAVLGHPYGPNPERGIFRSTDGGKTFDKVLYKDENTGGSEVAFDPSNPDIVYAGLWESRQGPWENAAWSGTGGGLFKSTDGGTTWKQLSPAGADGVLQVNLGIAPSDGRRIYAAVAIARGTGLYRSDDAGETWTRLADTRPAGRIGGGDLPRPAVHPSNPDIVFVASTVSWKSVDGGKTFAAFKGAPGGDDYQNIWINPTNPDVLLIASDQGAVVTVNGGRTWSSWYNQPTAQLYHVAADNAFPYRVYSGQQESGSAGVASRGNDGRITFREWQTVGVDEYGYAAPDPLDADIVYGGRSVTRFDRRTGQVQNVGPNQVRGASVRTVRTQPVVFSAADPRVLFYATNTLWRTSNGGKTWQSISPDLTRKTWDVPASVGKYKAEATAQPSQRGVIYTIGPSPLDIGRIWIGTDDGLIQRTTDGGRTWTNVTPPEIGPWAKVSIIDAGRFDQGTAYAAVNTLRLDDMRPFIYRTHDDGRTWTRITSGIPDGAPVNVVREDPKRKGLLFAGTEREIYVSFDDGDHWQSLRLNMPATSMRDLIVKDDDIVVATHGRGFWILDDITPLRQLGRNTIEAEAFLFKPQTATRVRWNMGTDTPLPPDEPAGENPPDGAIIHYALKSDAAGPVTLEILDAAGRVIRRYASTDPVEKIDPATVPVPIYWYRPPQTLGATAGMNRFLWDMRYQPLPGGGGRGGLPISATPFNTVSTPNAIWAPPGKYSVRLTANGKSITQPLTLRIDPRVKTSAAEIARISELSVSLNEGALWSQAAVLQVRAVRTAVKTLIEKAGQAPIAKELTEFDKTAAALEGAGAVGAGQRGAGGGAPQRSGAGAAGGQDTISGIGNSLTPLMTSLQAADAAPPDALAAAIADRLRALNVLKGKWNGFKTTDLVGMNARLKAAGLPAIEVK
jgi:photosystem II stability/assembly factor-like uncharacterized protein